MLLSPGVLDEWSTSSSRSDRCVRARLLAIRRRAGHQAGAEDRQASGEGGARAEEAGRARAAAPLPPPAPPSDVRYKTTYVNADQTTESTTFIRDTRERYELGDTILIKQRDQKRTVQISQGANTYLITPDGAIAAAAAVAAARTPPKPPGVVNVNVSIIDLGERKTAFDREARRVQDVDRSSAAARRVRSNEAA